MQPERNHKLQLMGKIELVIKNALECVTKRKMKKKMKPKLYPNLMALHP